MSQELIPTKSSSLPTIRTASRREVEAKVEELHGRLVTDPARPTHFSVPRALAPTTAERRALSAVRERLEVELMPHDEPDLVEAVVTKMLKGFELGRGVSDLDAKVTVGEFVQSVRKLPLWAIKAAADRFRDRENLLPWNKAFRPTTAEFADEAKAGMVERRCKLIHTKRVLDAEVLPEPRAADMALVQKLAAEFAARGKVSASEGGAPQPTPLDLVRMREGALHAAGANLALSAAGGGLDRLMAHLDERHGRSPVAQEFTGEGGQA